MNDYQLDLFDLSETRLDRDILAWTVFVDGYEIQI